MSCWVFDLKVGPDGQIEHFKARLVARGFSQEFSKDYNDTFAPVIHLESLRVLFTLAATYGLIAHLMDATNAYVGSQIDKRIIMSVPQGVEALPDHVCEILQSLYGLKQSGRLWHQKISQFITSMGFKATSADPSVFIDKRGTIIALYVDDLLVFGKDEQVITPIKKKLNNFHPMKDSGLTTKILSIHISWLCDRITLDQEHYTREILTEFGMDECKITATPLSLSMDLLGTESPKLSKPMHLTYQ